MAGLLRNKENGPRLFTIISVNVLVLSFAPLVNQADTERFTKIVLVFAHVLIFFAVVPTLRKRMA